MLSRYMATELRGMELRSYVAMELRSYVAMELHSYKLRGYVATELQSYPARRIKSCYGAKRVRGECGISKATRQCHSF